MLLKLAFRNTLRHGLRSALTLAAIAFGVAALVVSGGFVQDIFVNLREATIHSQLGHIQIHRAGYAKFGRRAPYKYLINTPSRLVADLGKLPHVLDVLQRLRFSGMITTGRADLPVVGEGVQPAKEARLGTFLTIIGGHQLRASDRNGILVGQGLADALRIKPGNVVTLMASTADGALNSLDFVVAGIFRTFSKDYDDHAVRIPLASAHALLATSGVHTLVLSLDETSATDSVAAQLRRKLAGHGFEVQTWYQLADFYRKTVALYRRQFGVMQVILLIMVLLSVTNSVNAAIFERTGELGTQMALGDRRWAIFRLLLMENLLLGLMGAGIGVLAGIGIALGVSHIGIPMPPPPNSNSGYTAVIPLVPWVIVAAFGIGVVGTLLAAILPARRATRLHIADALRENI